MNLRNAPRLSMKISWPPRRGTGSRFLWGLGVGIAACATAAAFIVRQLQRAHPKEEERAKGASHVNGGAAAQEAQGTPQTPAA
jgi:hypothetical protein